MSEHDTITPETDDEIRARLRSFAQEVRERTDTDAALEHMPRRWRPSAIQLVAIAAAFILLVAVAAALIADRQSLDTVPPMESPSTMSGSAPRTLARGVVDLVGPPIGECVGTDLGNALMRRCLSGQTLDITAVLQDGELTGQARFAGIVVKLQCVDTRAPHGLLAFAGEVTTSRGGPAPSVGTVIAVFIREGEPDSATVWAEEHESCPELFDAVPVAFYDFRESYVDVVAGDDIETGTI